jgi:hypothetical protein
MPAAPPGPPPPVTSIAEAITRMEAIDASAPASDGVACFNRMYLEVTQQVDKDLGQQFFADPAFMTRFDVAFANLYFDAVNAAAGQSAGAAAGQSTVPLAWRPLFERRGETGIEPIQFALAGMNAHINHDLALALVATDADLNVVPASDSPEFADYQSVNELLNSVMPSALNMLATDTLGVLAQDTGKVGRLLAFWDISHARDLAWDFANQLRSLDSLARDAALAAQDGLTGVIGRAILAAA